MQIKISGKGVPDCENCGMRSASLFADLSSEDLRSIHHPIHDLALESHVEIFGEGEAGTHLYTVRSGLVKLVRFHADGSQRIVRLLRTGDVAGIEVTAGSAYASTAITLTEVTACRIPKVVVDQLEKDSPRLHGQLMLKWQSALKQAEDFVSELGSGTARQRLARLLLMLAPEGRDVVSLPSREDVGAMLGITTETASRTVASFRREGLLRNLDRQGRHFQVQSSGLTSIAEGSV